MPTFSTWLGYTLTVLLVISCASIEKGIPPKNLIIPQRAAPGNIVQVRLKAPVFAKHQAVKVTIGDKTAVLKSINAHSVAILVPMLAPGKHSLLVTSGRKTVHKDQLEVLATSYTRLTMSMSGDKIQLLSQQAATAGQARQSSTGGKMLAYDVLTKEGKLVFTGITHHPIADRREVFEPEGKMHGVKAPLQQIFTLKIPALTEGAIIRWYEIDTASEQKTKKARQARRFLNDIEIGG